MVALDLTSNPPLSNTISQPGLAIDNRHILSLDQNVARDSVEQIDAGSEFHILNQPLKMCTYPKHCKCAVAAESMHLKTWLSVSLDSEQGTEIQNSAPCGSLSRFQSQFVAQLVTNEVI